MTGTMRLRPPRTGGDESMHSGVLHRYEHGLGDAVEMDTAPRRYLPFGHDHGSAGLLVQADSSEIDRIAERHVEGGQEEREGGGAGLNRQFQGYRDDLSEHRVVAGNLLRDERLRDRPLPITQRGEARIRTELTDDLEVASLQGIL